jgi:hypothetical protein
MKSIKEMEDMSLEQLEAVSMDMNIPVPEGFEERLKKDIGTLDRLTTDDTEYGRRARTVRIISVAAAATLLVGTGIAIRQNEPKDTFDDPYMAYAELEKAFATMSGGMQKALAMAEESEAALDKVTSIFE